MKNIIGQLKIFVLRGYYGVICFLTDLVKSRLLMKHKLLTGTLLLTLMVSSCHVLKPHHTCHKRISHVRTEESDIKTQGDKK